MKFKQVVLGVGLAMVGGIAAGGTYTPAPVVIDFDTQLATGDMYTARLADDPDTYIGCGLRAPAPGVMFGFCQAQVGPAPEGYVSCFTEDPVQVAAIGAMDDLSWISFRWDADGNCSSVGNSTQSFYLPEFHKTDKNK
jgi:hypothetical protein